MSIECGVSRRYSEDRWAQRFEVTTPSLTCNVEDQGADFDPFPTPTVPSAKVDSDAATAQVSGDNARATLSISRWAIRLAALWIVACMGAVAGGLWLIAVGCGFAAHLFAIVWLATQDPPEKSHPLRSA